MQFIKALLLTTLSAGIASAADVCPPTYCSLGARCGYDPNGPHCCGAGDDKNVLQCVNGKWAVRNRCNSNQFCTCTGRKDLVCRTNNKQLAEGSGQPSAADAAEAPAAA